MKRIEILPIGFVINNRKEKSDFEWGKVQSVIELSEEFTEDALDGIDQFSHLEILFNFHLTEKVFKGSEHPRGDTKYPKVGIFAQRKKDRPNHIGATIVKLVKKEGRRIYVNNLDAIDGTPVLDIKPVFYEYLPREDVKQPKWVTELMDNYW